MTTMAVSMRACGSGFMKRAGARPPSSAPWETMGRVPPRLALVERKNRMMAVWKIFMPMTFLSRLPWAIIA